MRRKIWWKAFYTDFVPAACFWCFWRLRRICRINNCGTQHECGQNQGNASLL